LSAPSVSSTSPAASATGVYLNAAITITMDQALLVGSVGSATVVIRSVALDEVVDAEISASGAVITIMPHQMLIAESVYEVALMGADLGLSTGAIRASDNSELADTYTFTFQTGLSLDTSSLTKTSEETALEGGIFLPTDVVVRPTSFSILSTSPVNHSFGIRRDKETITVTFSSDIQSSTIVDGDTVQVTSSAFLGEEGFLAVAQDNTGDLLIQQEWDGVATGYDYSDMTGILTISGPTLTWTKDTGRDWPANSCVEVFLDATITDTGSNALGSDQKITFYVLPHPYPVKVSAVRSELGNSLPSTYLDDYVGLRTWFRTIETWEELGRSISLNADFNKNRSFKQYIRCQAALDMLDDVRAEKDLHAGVSKQLGDYRVSYFPQGAETLSRKEQTLHKMSERAWESMMRYITRPQGVVKGGVGSSFLGTRQWRAPYAVNTVRGFLVSDPIPAANTSRERDRITPGYAEKE